MKVVHANSFSQLLKLEKKVPLDPNIVMLGDSRWEAALEEFRNCAIFAYDVETFGSEKWHPLWFRTGLIRLVQVGLLSGLVLVVDLGGWEDDRSSLIKQYKDFFDILAIKLPDPEVLVLGTNLKFDGVFTLAHFGIKLRGARDLMLLSQLLYGGVAVLPAGSGERQLFGHGLGKICERENIEIDKQEQISNWGWDLSNEQLNYAAYDTSVLFKLFKLIGEKIVEAGLKYSAESECAALSAFIDMEYYGFPVDLDLLDDYIKQHEDHLKTTIKPFTDLFPDINWNSGEQVLKVLQERYPTLDISSTSADVLAPLDLPECNALLKSRTIQTTTKYLINLRDVAFKSKDDHLMAVRGFYQQIAPEATGRSSCKASLGKGSGNIGAQLQNPKASSADEGILPHPRDIFRVPDTHKLIVLDAAASHARIACAMAKPKVLIQSYNEGFDNHSLLGVDVAKIARSYYQDLKKGKAAIMSSLQDIFDAMPKDRSWNFEEFVSLKKKLRVVGDIRDICKIILYGSLNGAGVGRLTNEMHGKGFEWVIPEIVSPMRQFFYDLYPEIPAFIKNNFKLANSRDVYFDFKDINGKIIGDTYGSYGYVTALTGRRKYLLKEEKDAWGKKVYQVDYGKSTAALWLMAEGDMMKDWMGRCIALFDANPNWGAYFANFAHDEVNFVCRAEYAAEAAETIYYLMKDCFEKWLKIIPFDEGPPKNKDKDYAVDFSMITGTSWSDLH